MGATERIRETCELMGAADKFDRALSSRPIWNGKLPQAKPRRGSLSLRFL